MTTPKFRKGDVAISKVNVIDKLTMGKPYIVTQTGTHFTRIMDDNGVEFRMAHDRFEFYFEKAHVNVNVPKGEDYDKDLQDRRLANPLCDCGGWSVKDAGHSHWCKSLQKKEEVWSYA